MSHEVTSKAFQAVVSLPKDTDLDELVGEKGVDVVGSSGCGTAHVSRSPDAHGAYDVAINGQLLKHLSKDQIKGLHLDRCTGDKPAAGASDSRGASAQTAQTADAKPVVRHDKERDRTVTELKNFNPPGWEEAGDDHEACYRLAVKGAEKTCAKTDSPVGGGGVILYRKVERNIATDKEASAVALAQIKAHIDAGKAVIAGVNVPAIGYAVDKVRQPVTDHFVDIYGYETDAKGKMTAILAKDNAVPGAPPIRMEIGADGSITKSGSENPKTKAVADMKYQLSEVRFHTSLPYAGNLRPIDDAHGGMVWWPK